MSPSLSKSPGMILVHQPFLLARFVAGVIFSNLPLLFFRNVTAIHSPVITRSCHPSLLKSVHTASHTNPTSCSGLATEAVTSVNLTIPLYVSFRYIKLDTGFG